MRNRFPLNAKGDFYTTGYRDKNGEWCGACLNCALPESEAPSLLAPLGESHTDTYFIKQPETDEEIAQAISAGAVCCVNAIRYGGKDKSIIKRMWPGTSDYKINILGHVVPTETPWWKFLA